MKRPVAATVASMLVTAISVVLVLNLNMGDDSIDRRIEHRYTAGSPQFVRVMNAMLGPGMPGSNRVEALVNGDAFFPAMLGAIAGARHTICFETYIYWSGDIGKAFAERLSERARSGVRVHVVLDWLGGGKLEQAAHESMAATSRNPDELMGYHLSARSVQRPCPVRKTGQPQGRPVAADLGTSGPLLLLLAR